MAALGEALIAAASGKRSSSDSVFEGERPDGFYI